MMSEYYRDQALEDMQKHLRYLEDYGVLVDRQCINLEESGYLDYFGYNCHSREIALGHVSIEYNGVTYTAYVGSDVGKYNVIDKETSLE